MSMFRNLIMQSGGGDAPLYKQILARMARETPALRAALKCWYCPKLQGLTNADLAAHYPIYTDGLRDLSGNNYHIILNNFDGNIYGKIDAQYNLLFNGSNTSAISAFNIQGIYSVIGSFFIGTMYTNYTPLYVGDVVTITPPNRVWQYLSGYVRQLTDINIIKNTQNTIEIYTAGELKIGSSYNEVLTRGVRPSSNFLAFGYRDDRQQYYAVAFKSYTVFDRDLTQAERNYVKENLVEI